MDKLSYDEVLNSNYNICLIYYNEPRSSDVNFSIEDLTLTINKDIFQKYYDYGYNEFKKFYNNLIKKNNELVDLINNKN